MQTSLTQQILNTAEGQEADAILRNCVHCGFCTATCPTYQLLGDELDGPRGRIYLIKQMLEGQAVTQKTQMHLDRCLTCRSCETTCPSGVQYGRLIDIGRGIIEKKVTRSFSDTWLRRSLRWLLPHPARFNFLVGIVQPFRGWLPEKLRRKIPKANRTPAFNPATHSRKMILLESCGQHAMAPGTNYAAIKILDRLGITLSKAKGVECCGAVSYHLGAHEEGLNFMRRTIDFWWPQVESGIEAIVITASGCGSLVKEYGHLLQHDPVYAEKAKKISALTFDLSEILAKEDLGSFKLSSPVKVAYHSPCSLQHGQKITGIIESILTKVGYSLTFVPDPHICCGSAGTYSILQQQLSQRLLENKISALQENQPNVIATANIGCQLHLQTASAVPVKHWIELLNFIDDHRTTAVK